MRNLLKHLPTILFISAAGALIIFQTCRQIRCEDIGGVYARPAGCNNEYCNVGGRWVNP